MNGATSGSRTTRSGRTARRDEPVGQTLAHRMATAERVILANLGTLGYGELHSATAAALRIDRPLAGPAFLRALLDLERRDVITHGVDGIPRAHDPVVDPPLAPLAEVATAILALEWPRPRNRKDVHSIFADVMALGRRVRHSDVYDALWDHLYGHELEHVGQTTWRPRGELAIAESILGDPTRTVAEVEAARAAIEQGLVDAYVASRPDARLVEQWPVDGLRADVYDADRRMVIEAKADSSPTTVAHALGQANLYRNLANTDTARKVERVALLLPKPLCDRGRRHVALEGGVDIVTLQADGTFAEERFA